MYFCRRMNVFLWQVYFARHFYASDVDFTDVNYIAAETETKVKLPELY